MNNLKIKEINNAKLDPVYVSVYILKNTYKIYKNSVKEDDTFYTVIGVNLKNQKHILYMTHQKSSEVRMWIDIFERLKQRGVNEIIFLSSLEDKNIKKALRISYPCAKFTPSLVELTEILYRYTPLRSNRDVFCKLRKLYLAETIEDYKENAKSFDDFFNNPIQIAIKEKYLRNVEAIYNIPYKLRLLIYSGYKNLEYYNELRLFFSNQIFLNIDDLYSKLENSFIDDFITCSFSKNEWT
ncbi:MAG: transposase, partial [bacterium]